MTQLYDKPREFLLVSDFDQTLSFKDSGAVLSEIVGIHDFSDKVDRLSKTHLVQQGGELAYLLLHDPDFRKVRREHLARQARECASSRISDCSRRYSSKSKVRASLST